MTNYNKLAYDEINININTQILSFLDSSFNHSEGDISLHFGVILHNRATENTAFWERFENAMTPL